MKAHKLFMSFAALFGLIAVVAGAIGAHGTELSTFCTQCSNLSEESLLRLNTAVDYQFYHVTGLLFVGILLSLHRNYSSVLLKLSGTAFILGILLFSGGLYAFVLTENIIFRKVTPYGGISFILAWIFLFIYALKK